MSVFFPFSFSNLRTKNYKRIPFSFFVFKSEVRKTKNEFLFRFSFANLKTKMEKTRPYKDRPRDTNSIT